MGDTAPPQAPTGGLGGASGAGLLGGGSVTPRVHSAIVERLRARIAVCRQHHLSCEGRYERGRAESSDRERESTLQLLSLVQHGQGARKAGKHTKVTTTAATTTAPAPPAAAPPVASQAASTAAPPPPPDYHHHHQQHLLTSSNAGGGGGINGEQQPPASTLGDQRNSALIALQGSLKRKQVVSLSPANSKRPNGFIDSSFLDIKRIRVGENLSAGPGGLQVNNGQSQLISGTLPMSQAPLRKTNTLPPHTHSPGNGMFNMGLKEVKKEPGETLSCSKHMDGQATQESIFTNRYGDDSGEQLMDPELQELFNELTNISVPPMSDLELEDMINATIKQDGPFSMDLGQQGQRSTPRPSLPMEKIVIKSEYSPGLTQGPAGSPQLRPPSAGPAFSMANSALSTSSPIPSVPQSQAQPQTASGASRALPSWQEVSHAQQLKQIAANRQQHARLQQQHQSANWSALPSTAGPSPGPFGPEKIPSPSFGQQPFSSQSSPMPGVAGSSGQPKAVSSYMYKASPSAQGGHLDGLMQPKPQDLSRSFINNPHPAVEPCHGNTKPLFHFNSEQASQQMPSVLPSQNKPSLLHYTQQQQQQQQSSISAQQQQQQQSSISAQQQQSQPQPPPSQPTQPMSSQPLVRSPLPLQQKILLQQMQNQPITGLGYQVSQQHRQDQHSVVGQNTGPSPSPSPCSNPNTGSGFMNSQQSLLNQQLMGKKQTLQRQIMEQKQQLLLQQQMLVDTEKIASQDQINRHLTRPPPDYKDQRRNVGSMQPAAQYSGGSSSASLNSNQALTNPVSAHTILTPNSNLMSTSHGPRMPSLSTAVQSIGMYGNLPCNQPGTYSVASGMNQLTQQRNPNQLIANQSNPLMPRPPTLGPSNNNTFGAGTVGNSQLRPNLAHSMASVPAQRTSNVMITPNTTAPSWVSQEATSKQPEALKSTGVRFPTGAPTAYTPNQSLQQAVGSQQFPQRAVAPPSQLTPATQMRPMNQMSQTLKGQAVGPFRGLNLRPSQLSTQILPNLNQSGTGLNQSRTGINQPPSLTPNNFPSSNQSSRAFQGTDHGSDLAFDFLSQQTDNMGPALNSDADFIDSLLKTEPGNDDWMKDINLDEILGNNS
ncbi:mastermind-like protein 2 isoform X1 [Nycticebus coucang]|uniref:mastermind-like protein 2 isoform X1 n=1 Tax=Nycticebus coucang TaxID=9470 RepID=UPI00234E0B95|nr:mastermind-like protein 2 isoform X1 [Nycticebus coucang]XP_053417416.1 mastermind-like protein 2 isoform X1 [Nycticebus coucang]